MNKYNFLIKLVLGALLLVNAFLIWQNQNKPVPVQQKASQEPISQVLRDDISYCTYYENLALGQQLQNADIETTHEKIDLAQHAGDQGLIIFRYNEIHCDICVDSTVLILNELRERVDADNFLYLTTYKNVRDKVTFQRTNNIDSPVYNIDKLNTALEKVDRPYILHLDEDLRVIGAMVADKDQLFRLRAFASSIVTRVEKS